MCRHYLPHGRRRGHYWVTGDVDDTPGRSLYVRLSGPDSGPGAAGKWSDAATGEHGDLLDLIGRRRHLPRLADAIGEARAFLALPHPSPAGARAPALTARRPARRKPRAVCSRSDGRFPALRPKPICAPAGITARLDWPSLRFHPSVWYRESEAHPREAWPALLAAVTDHARHHHRHPAQLARPHRHGQGAGRRSAPRPRPSARQRCPLRQRVRACAGGGHRSRRRRRNDAGARLGVAVLAADRRPLGQPPRRPCLRSVLAPPLCRARQRCRRSSCGNAIARTRAGSRYRSPRPRAGARGLQRRSLRPRPRRAPRRISLPSSSPPISPASPPIRAARHSGACRTGSRRKEESLFVRAADSPSAGNRGPRHGLPERRSAGAAGRPERGPP